jgi:transcriptional regulator with XRE-family HTH domain
MAMEDLGKRVSRHRGSMGIRAAAREIDISPTTLSRIEHGHIPDLKTLQKICDWMGEDPAKFIGAGSQQAGSGEQELQIAFKKKSAVSAATSKSLANLIVLASEQFTSSIEAEGH